MAETRTVLFVCLHGAAKSVIAAQYLQRLAHTRGVALECASAGLEPDDTVPPHVVDGLRADGFEYFAAAPRQVTPEMVSRADTVVSFGCDLSDLNPSAATLVNWENVPDVSNGFAAARDDIARRVQRLIDELT